MTQISKQEFPGSRTSGTTKLQQNGGWLLKSVISARQQDILRKTASNFTSRWPSEGNSTGAGTVIRQKRKLRSLTNQNRSFPTSKQKCIQMRCYKMYKRNLKKQERKRKLMSWRKLPPPPIAASPPSGEEFLPTEVSAAPSVPTAL